MNREEKINRTKFSVLDLNNFYKTLMQLLMMNDSNKTYMTLSGSTFVISSLKNFARLINSYSYLLRALYGKINFHKAVT